MTRLSIESQSPRLLNRFYCSEAPAPLAVAESCEQLSHKHTSILEASAFHCDFPIHVSNKLR